MAVFKVVARDPKTKRQTRKKVYVGEAFTKYSEKLINRWVRTADIEIYEFKDSIGDYELWYTKTQE